KRVAPIYMDHPKTYLKLTGPPVTRKEKIKEAVNYAMFRCALEVHPIDHQLIIDYFISLRYDPSITTTNPNTPAGVGNRIASLHIETARKDGLNSQGDHPNTDGTPFSDPVNFVYANDPSNCR